jgi:hypothetical protein
MNSTIDPGSISSFNNAVPLQVGSWTSPTTFQAGSDGFVVGVISWPANASVDCIAWMFGASGDTRMYSTGGNANNASNGASFTLPVAAGSEVTLGMMQGSGNQTAAPVSAIWIPVGIGAAGSSIEQIASKPNAMALPGAVRDGDRQAAPAAFLSAIEQALGRPISADAAGKLLAALQGI